MPWNLQNRDGEWCVVKSGDENPVPGGCHSARVNAIRHQRALYAQESRMASMYAELDAQPDPEPEVEVAAEPKSELVKIVVGHDTDVLTASMMQQIEAMSQRQTQTDQALVAALQAIGQRDNVFHVPASEVSISVPPAEVNVTVPSPEVNVHVPPAEVTVNAPDVNVTVEAPSVQKTVTFERDPLTQQVTRAEVTEA